MNRETIKETVCKAGIDIGSTTVKLVISDEENRLLFGEYKRHMAHTKDALLELLTQAAERLGDRPMQVHITGSGPWVLPDLWESRLPRKSWPWPRL